MQRHDRLVHGIGSLAASLAAISGCSADIPAPTRIADPSSRALVARSSQVVTSDDRLARLAADVPGFGGVFLDDAGIPTVWLKNPQSLAGASARLTAYLAAAAPEGSAARAQIVGNAASMKARQGQFDFVELLSAYRQHVAPAVHVLPGVTMTDIDDRANRIVVGVDDASALVPVEAAVRALPVPVEMVTVVVAGGTRRDVGEVPGKSCLLPPNTCLAATSEPLTSPVPVDSTLGSKWRPVLGAAAIEGLHFVPGVGTVPKPCTIGYNAVAWIGDTVKTDRFFLSNSHCTYTIASLDGDAVVQPFHNQANFVAVEAVDPAWHTYQYNPNCTPSLLCRFADVALYKYNVPTLGPSASQRGVVLTTPSGSTTVTGSTVVTTELAVTVGDWVKKIGATTGTTTGQITQNCVDLISPDYPNTPSWYLCQAVANYSASGGDSGGPVLMVFANGTSWAVGIHWGSNVVTGVRYFSPVQGALQELYDGWSPSERGVLDITGAAPPPPPPPPPPPTVSIVGPSKVRSNATCLWTSSVSGSGPFSYYWTKNGSVVSTGSSATTSFASSGTLQLQVWDSYSQSTIVPKAITVQSTAPQCLF